MDIQGNQRFGQGYWIDRFKPASVPSTTIVSGGGGTTSTAFQRVTLSGAINSINKVFVLPYAPTSGQLRLYLNGLNQTDGIDFTLADTVITMTSAPSTGDNLIAYAGLTLTGAIDGVNNVFVLPVAPDPLILQLYKNGQLMTAEGNDFTLSGATITMTLAPNIGDLLIAYTNGTAKKETPSGILNSSNKVFTLVAAPDTKQLQFFWNGFLQFEGIGNDFVLNGNQITMTLSPSSGDSLIAYY